MANVRMITTALNNYFVNNKIMIGSEIPTDGNYNVGDIMIKENQVAGEAIGWVCVTGGSPATWSEFGKEPVLEDGSVNMAKLADDVRLKLALIDAVNVSIKSVRSDIDDLQTDVETLTSDVENINTVIEEKVGENDTRIVMGFHPTLAPYKVAILPCRFCCKMDREKSQMKRILVTGGTVFVSKIVASYFASSKFKDEYQVYVLNRNNHPQVENVILIHSSRENLKNKLEEYKFDISNIFQNVLNEMKRIFHCCEAVDE